MRRSLAGLCAKGALSLLALMALTTCGGNSPSSPTQGSPGGAGNGSGSGSSGGSGGEVGRVEILRAPDDGSIFKVNTIGELPQPAPKFRLSITTPTDVPKGYLNIELLNAGSLRCGGVLMNIEGFTAGTAKQMDIPNEELVVGPESCAYGFNCSRTQCALPVTTTRIRVIISEDDGEVLRHTEEHRYIWEEGG